MPSLNAASTRSEGIVFYSHLDKPKPVPYSFICFCFLYLSTSMTNCDIILNEFLQRTQIIRTVFGRWLICFISWFLYALESWQCFFVKFLCMWAYSWTWTTHEKRTFVHIVLPISPIQHGIYPLTMLHFDLQILLAQKKYFIVFFFFLINCHDCFLSMAST